MRFGVASNTKTVVAATIMKLVDEGILTLDDTLGEWVSLNNTRPLQKANLINFTF